MLADAPVIQANNLGKRYQLGETTSLGKTLRATKRLAKNLLRRLFFLTPLPGPEHPYVWAARNISFEVKKGEVFGIIGHNGSGKSTLLKLLSRITFPTEGTAKINGRVASLLEVGTGFNAELSGYDNIYLNGCILGMSKKEIDQKFDDIVAFSGIGKFIHTPIKRLSSGMSVRLGFAIASHLEPEIMIIDEVLAVGDADFQQKCLERMEQIRNSGRTILFVSHNMDSIAGLCDRVMWLNRGEIKLVGKPKGVIQAYLDHSSGNGGIENLAERTDRQQKGDLHITRLILKGSQSQENNLVVLGDDAKITLTYRSKQSKEFKNLNVWFGIVDGGGRHIVEFDTNWTQHTFKYVAAEGQISCLIPKWPFTPGVYSLSVRITAEPKHQDEVRHACSFVVKNGDYYGQKKACHSRSLTYHSCEWSTQTAVSNKTA